MKKFFALSLCLIGMLFFTVPVSAYTQPPPSVVSTVSVCQPELDQYATITMPVEQTVSFSIIPFQYAYVLPLATWQPDKPVNMLKPPNLCNSLLVNSSATYSKLIVASMRPKARNGVINLIYPFNSTTHNPTPTIRI